MQAAPHPFERPAAPLRQPPVFESRPMPPREAGAIPPREPQRRERESEPRERPGRAPTLRSAEGMGG